MTLWLALEESRKYQELLTMLKVRSLEDAKASITGLRERVRYTESFESLLFQRDKPCECLCHVYSTDEHDVQCCPDARKLR